MQLSWIPTVVFQICALGHCCSVAWINAFLKAGHGFLCSKHSFPIIGRGCSPIGVLDSVLVQDTRTICG